MWSGSPVDVQMEIAARRGAEGSGDVEGAQEAGRGGAAYIPLVGKQRLENDMMARPPGLSTRCISLNTSSGLLR
jgi:hypothetical protein